MITTGIINVLKPAGMTSHDVVSFIRKTFATKKVGHAGTLDPDAAGVLPIFIGNATRLLEYAVNGKKVYRVEFTFGSKTDSGDDSGNVIKKSAVKNLEIVDIEKVLKNFTGEIMQVPPMYSALKVNGKKLYELARKGIEVEREARPITIHSLKLVHYEGKYCICDVECSKGTYIRTLVEDISESLDMYGTMTFLLRKQVADFKLENAYTIEEILEKKEKCLLPLDLAVKELPVLKLSNMQALRISQGVRTTVLGTKDGIYKLETIGGRFFGIGKCLDEIVKGEKILKVFSLTDFEE